MTFYVLEKSFLLFLDHLYSNSKNIYGKPAVLYNKSRSTASHQQTWGKHTVYHVVNTDSLSSEK